MLCCEAEPERWQTGGVGRTLPCSPLLATPSAPSAMSFLGNRPLPRWCRLTFSPFTMPTREILLLIRPIF